MNSKEAAEKYIEAGLYPIPLHKGRKACKEDEWKTKIYTAEDFLPDDNVGLRLISSKDDRKIKTIAVDLDYPETVEIAETFLPRSSAKWGRPTKRISQILYNSPFKETVAFKDISNGSKTIIEIRTDHQSMAPPSVHPNGEHLDWLPGADYVNVPTVEPEELLRAVQLIATAAIIGKYYNPPGNRHDWGIALCGSLRYFGLSRDEAVKVVTESAKIAKADKLQDRLTELHSTYDKSDDAHLVGSKKLAELTTSKGATFVTTLQKIWQKAGTSSSAVSSDFICDSKGKIISNNQDNVRRAIEKLEVRLSYDLFSNRMFIAGRGDATPRILDDAILDRVWLTIDDRFGFRPTREFFDTVIRDQSRINQFHPVRDYLATLKWDGIPRIDTWLIVYGGAKDNDFVRAVCRLFLVAAVRRVMAPGAKFDELVILESTQGWDKSTALRALCPRDEWFSDDLPLNVDAKQIIERTTGKWIIEASELSGMRKSQIEQLKAMLSRQVDGPVRQAYARLSVEVRRQFVAIGSTNSKTYLKDHTGNRRFWPVAVGRFDTPLLLRDRDQIWAEAAHSEATGESIRMSPNLWHTAEKIQSTRAVEDPWEPTLVAHFETIDGMEQRILPSRIWDVLEISVADRDERSQERIVAIMQKLGFRRMSMRVDGKVGKGWGRDLIDGIWRPVGWGKDK